MFRSMTAYARAAASTDDRDVTVEIKSVNSKNLDMSVKAPHALLPLEARIRAAVCAHGVSRGRVDVLISYQLRRSALGEATVAVNHDYAAAYIAALRTLRDTYSLPDDISVMTVAQDRNVFDFAAEEEEQDPEEIWAQLLPLLDEAAEAFTAARLREGANLQADLLAKIAGMRETVDRIEALSLADTAGALDRVRARVTALLKEMQVTVDENRLLTECAIWADKIAIDEELVRLRSHFSALEAMAELDEPVGRRFDYQLQETNREVNTIGSKCQNAEIAKLVVSLKNELEKLREQIQNIE